MEKITHGFIAIFVAVLWAVFGSSCQSQGNQETLTSGECFIACDESFEPVIEEEILQFETTYPKATLIPYYVSEEKTFEMLVEDSVRMIIATRPITPAEEAKIAERKLKVRSEIIALDAMAIIVNKNNPDSVLAVTDLREIMSGEVTRWDQLYKGSKLGEIEFVFDKQGSSSMRYAIDSLNNGRPLSRRLHVPKADESVIDYVAKTPNAMGVIGASWVGAIKDSTFITLTDDVKVMYIQRSPGFSAYRPSPARILTKDYPLVRPVYAIRTDPGNGLPTGFTIFLTKQVGQLILYRSNLLPWYYGYATDREVLVSK